MSEEYIGNDEIEMGEQIGKGAYGIVYKAVWNRGGLKVDVAVKEIPMITFPKKNVLREFRSLKSMEHDCTLSVYGYNIHEKSIRIITDLMEGNLRELLNRVDLDMYERIEVVRKLIQSIDFLHKKNMIHRDIKSTNFLYSDEGRRICVCDFGLAATLQNSIAPYHSESNKLRGSVPWISPELMTGVGGKVEYNIKSDIYALGITIWEVLTGRIPFTHIRGQQLILHLVKEDELRITDQYEGKEKKTIPEEFRKIVSLCCERDPQKRPTTTQLLKYLQEIEKTISKFEEIWKKKDKSTGDRLRKRRRRKEEKEKEEEEGEEGSQQRDSNTSSGSSVISLVKSLGSGAFKAFKVVVFNQYVDDGSKENPDENI